MKMEDVAKLAGVSKATVSRVVNNKKVTNSLREKVLSVINEVNYKPNAIAQCLSLSKKVNKSLIV